MHVISDYVKYVFRVFFIIQGNVLASSKVLKMHTDFPSDVNCL